MQKIKASLQTAHFECINCREDFWIRARTHWENLGYASKGYDAPLSQTLCQAITPELETEFDNATWHKFKILDSVGYWWWCESDGDWFLEDDPTPWVKYSDPKTGNRYWWKNDDKWFWIRTGSL